MEIVKDLLLVTIPALLVLITAWLVLRKSFDNDRDRRRQEIILQNARTITPIRLQAYERLTMFLERISVESLIMRVYKQGMESRQLHTELLSTVRSEYDHNLSQQIYISPQSWEVLKTAKTNTIKLINTGAEKIPPTASGADLSRFLLESVMELDKEPTQVAIEMIKKEVASIM
ncbi:MAG: hypothetical protein E4G95_08970 [Bacteroidia bacterium]|nr:MAG: hypothetical protein E4G95_08970 [Bacteroidia bacterium]